MTRFLTGPILFCSPYVSVPDDPIVAEFAATVDNDVVAVVDGGDAIVVADMKQMGRLRGLNYQNPN